MQGVWVMTPIERLIDHIDSACIMLCKEQDRMEIYEFLLKAIEEYNSTPRPWTPPWPLKIPDWKDVWVSVDHSGSGYLSPGEPHIVDKDSNVWCMCKSSTYVSIGQFEIQPGVDWRTMKIQVKKDGVLLR